ncbi:CotS family spore coat protein [Gottfriedia acidiceleris]|uniref:CotS family spore coat protein n=1 Tax=Gottfriedia acidiceleris TaxID=371036 RepID=A0ABY4JHK9_9BACI|nr:CotS family spore coat protein [Gottfriedia acidiceleris]UPM53326.1 CotS family spore coat protein [Gottfriedia acidiceleris]
MDAFFSELVKKVIANYPLEVKHKSLEYIDEKKAEWPIDTNIGEVLLKKVSIDERYIEFMIYAIDYLRDNGVFTPEVLTTKLGEGFVKRIDEYFMLFEAVNGRRPNFESEDDLILLMNGIASFHKASVGIELTTEQVSSIQSNWKNDLQNKFLKLTKWKEERAKLKLQNEIDKLFLKNINIVLMQCEKALAIVDKYIVEVVEEIAQTKTLCYQNFDVNDLIIGEDGNLYFFNMSSLKIELPIHDMRRILNIIMKKEKNWNPKLMKKIIIAYHEINPLACLQYQFLKADLLFPHLFYDLFSAHYENTEVIGVDPILVSEMKKIITLELSKEKVISSVFIQTNEEPYRR